MAFEDFCLNYHLSELDRKTLISYAVFFFANKKERLERFIDKIVADINIDCSEFDFSEKSLEVLYRWLVNHVECVKLTKEEYDVVRKSVPDYIDIDDWRFSDETYSNIITVGIYLGEVVIYKYPEFKWEQCFSGKRNINYGQMIIRLGKKEMNPMRLVYNICLEIVDHRTNATSLQKLLRIWEEYM